MASWEAPWQTSISKLMLQNKSQKHRGKMTLPKVIQLISHPWEPEPLSPNSTWSRAPFMTVMMLLRSSDRKPSSNWHQEQERKKKKWGGGSSHNQTNQSEYVFSRGFSSAIPLPGSSISSFETPVVFHPQPCSLGGLSLPACSTHSQSLAGPSM